MDKTSKRDLETSTLITDLAILCQSHLENIDQNKRTT